MKKFIIAILFLFLLNVATAEENLIPVIYEGKEYGTIVDGRDENAKCDEVRNIINANGRDLGYQGRCSSWYLVRGKWIAVGTENEPSRYNKVHIYNNLVKINFPESSEDGELYLDYGDIIGYVKNPEDAKPIILDETCVK